MERKTIIVSEELRLAWPRFTGGALYAEFANTAFCAPLWQEIGARAAELRKSCTVDGIKLMEGIAATRAAYKACGKDPSRYRPSNEQLARRIIQGKELWAVNTAVDIGNLASIVFHYSIGCFDYDMIQGGTVTLGVGRGNEPYEGIGRGALNIEGMPVYRDAAGGIGTPTSDNEQTQIATATTRMLALVNGYDGNKARVAECLGFMANALTEFLHAECHTEVF